MRPEIHDVAQRSPEWYALRLGRMTASDAGAIATAKAGLDTLCLELSAERMSGIPADNGFSNEDMERGMKLEEDARILYEWESGNVVKQVGFISYGEYAGCSPDGLVGEDGGVEIKCPNNPIFMRVVLESYIDPKYYAQMQMSLLITGRKWWDYVAYNPNFKKSLNIIRVQPDADKFSALEKGLALGEQKIKDIIKNMEEKSCK